MLHFQDLDIMHAGCNTCDFPASNSDNSKMSSMLLDQSLRAGSELREKPRVHF